MIFLSGRFRSGTTIMWDIYRQIPEICAYYEPFHDNLLDYIAADNPPDPSHTGVEDYFSEYKPILSSITKLHTRAFGVTRLCMGAHDEYPELLNYLRLLSDSANGRIPFFKFVRADLRLPWLRNKFPKAKIIYIKRNPRDNWLSIVSKSPKEEWEKDWLNTGFDLVIWSANLAPHFPFVGTNVGHSYARHYLLWRICTVVGSKYADLVIDLDQDLLIKPSQTIQKALEICDLDINASDELAKRVLTARGQIWENWSDKIPFDDIEQECDRKISESGLIEHITSGGLDTMGWPNNSSSLDLVPITDKLCVEVSEHRRLVPQFTNLWNILEAERAARSIEISEMKKQIAGLTEWATSADAYAKSLEVELENLRLQIKQAN